MGRFAPPHWSFTLSFFLLAACSHKPEAKAAPVELAPSALNFTVPVNRQADDLGRFLAGLPGKPGSSFLELEQRPEWIEHARICNQLWSRFEQDRLPAMQQFAQQELSGLREKSETAFYPFGGPDALTVTTFFPHHKRWVLVALEPPGTLVPAPTYKNGNLALRLANLRTTLDSLLSRSFFVTRQMDYQLRGQMADGVLVDVLVELVRRNYTVLGSQYLTITPEGQLAERTDPAWMQVKNRGVVLEVEDGGDHSIHQLYFLSVNLADDRLKQNPQFERVALTGAKVVTMLKSTSYMIHQDAFSGIRDMILNHGLAVLQDDSGIPYRFFVQRNFTAHFFGEYTVPFYPFQYRAQKDLREAFAKGENVKPLPFRIGYGYGRIPSNLTLALAPADVPLEQKK